MSNAYAATPPNAMRADALAGVRTRRILAVCIDLVLVSFLVAALWIVSIVLTFGLARSGDFVAVATPMAFVVSAVALAAGLALVVIFRLSRLGREWRAYADDPLAAEMMGISPAAITVRAFALSGALAGLAGASMTAAFGAVGYGLSATLTLKALTAAIVGGIGSLPGAFLGGLIVGAAETGWSALFPIDYRDIAVYVLLTIFIALRPSGLLGKSEAVTHNLFPRRS